MRLVISKNQAGNGYYSKIQNDYNGVHSEKILSIQVPKGNDLEYGLYEVDGFISCYNKKDGSSEFKLVLTNAVPVENTPKKKQELPTNQTGKEITQIEEYDPFKEFGEEIQITEDFLD